MRTATQRIALNGGSGFRRMFSSGANGATASIAAGLDVAENHIRLVLNHLFQNICDVNFQKSGDSFFSDLAAGSTLTVPQIPDHIKNLLGDDFIKIEAGKITIEVNVLNRRRLLEFRYPEMCHEAPKPAARSF